MSWVVEGRGPPPVRKWECACGKIHLKLRGDPLTFANCNCKSCNAVATYADAVGKKKNTSALAKLDDAPPVGCALAMWYIKDIELSKGTPEHFDYITVLQGDKAGTNVRSITKCCGTVCVAAGGKDFGIGFRALNRNCIKLADGKPWEFKNVMHILGAEAFDPKAFEKVPKAQRYYLAPIQFLLLFIGNIIMWMLIGFGRGLTPLSDPFIFTPPEKAKAIE